MKKILISMIACAMMLPLGCEKIKDATSRDFKVNNIQFDFTATTKDDVSTTIGNPSVTTRAAAITSFTVTRTVDISELGSDDLVEYANKINKIVVNNSIVSITASSAGDYTITNLTITAEGVGDLIIPSYSIGGTFSAPSNMNSYTSDFLMKLLSVKKINVTVKGQSDAPAGTTIYINYKSDIVCTASLL